MAQSRLDVKEEMAEDDDEEGKSDHVNFSPVFVVPSSKDELHRYSQ
jgi:hypothetical protein